MSILRLALPLAAVAAVFAYAAKAGSATASPGASAKAGDEVVLPLSAIPQLEAPPNAGGAVLAVDAAGADTLVGRVVAFVGSGGTADLRTPIGPIVVPRSAVSIVTVPPPDRVGRFADIGDDVAVDARDPGIAAVSRGQLMASLPAVQLKGLTGSEHVDSVLVRVERMSAPNGLAGVVRGFSFTRTDGTPGAAMIAASEPNAAGAAITGIFSRGSILGVSRDGTPIAARSRT